MHVVVTLSTRCRLEVAGASALDLHTTPGLLLDMLDIGTAVSDNLSS